MGKNDAPGGDTATADTAMHFTHGWDRPPHRTLSISCALARSTPPTQRSRRPRGSPVPAQSWDHSCWPAAAFMVSRPQNTEIVTLVRGESEPESDRAWIQLVTPVVVGISWEHHWPGRGFIPKRARFPRCQSNLTRAPGGRPGLCAHALSMSLEASLPSWDLNFISHFGISDRKRPLPRPDKKSSADML